MKNILIIGCGNIGLRHLQGALRSPERKLHVYDINFDHYHKMSTELPGDQNRVKLHSSVESLPKEVDLVISATGASVRFQSLKAIIQKVKFDKILLEKIPFNHLGELELAKKELSSRKIMAWVNCPRRTFPFYQKLKMSMGGRTLNVVLKGAQWGMSCNALHFLDLFEYLAEDRICHMSFEESAPPFESKRKSFFEIYGVLNANFKNGGKIELHCSSEGEMGVRLEFYEHTNSIFARIDESKRFMEIDKKKESFDFLYLSDLTEIMLRKLENNEALDLPTLEEQYSLDSLFLQTMSKTFNKYFPAVNGRCPIT